VVNVGKGNGNSNLCMCNTEYILCKKYYRNFVNFEYKLHQHKFIQVSVTHFGFAADLRRTSTIKYHSKQYTTYKNSTKQET
jgi:hypothetical protein